MEHQQSCRFDFTNYILLHGIVDRNFRLDHRVGERLLPIRRQSGTCYFYLASSIVRIEPGAPE
jgi:hypothetical protein